MILKEFNYQVIGQVIRMGNEQNNERLENGNLNATAAEDCVSQTADIWRLACLHVPDSVFTFPSIVHREATVGSVYHILLDLYKTSLFFSFIILPW